MITRSKLVEQLRDYQIRSQHKCPALTVFSPKPHITSWSRTPNGIGFFEVLACKQSYILLKTRYEDPIRADVSVAIFWASVFSVLVVSSYVSLYFRHFWLSFVIICLGIFVPVHLRISRQALARKKEGRLLLPLSM